MLSEIKRHAARNHSFFLYDLNVIDQKIESLRDLPSNVSVFYAMKANPHGAILRKMLRHPSIKGIEIASEGEARKVLEHTESLQRVIYTSPVKRPDELEFVLEREIRLINVESLTEAHRIQEIAKNTQPILLRINTNKEIHGAVTKMSSVNEPSPFGVSEEYACETIREINSLDKLSLQGVHIFSASGVLDASALGKHIAYALSLTSELERKTNMRFPTIDFGGGIGIDYEGDSSFDTSLFSSSLKKSIKLHKMEDKQLILELGRYLVAESGYFCTTISDIKESRGKKIILCSAGTNSHRRPYALQVNYPIEIISMGKEYKYPGQLNCKNELVQIRGPLCTEADILAQNAFVKHAEIGDLVVMRKSGAYGATMSHRDFLSHPHIPEIVVGDENE